MSQKNHIRQIDFIDTALDVVLFRDLKLINIISILRNLFIDKPVSLILLIFYLTIFLISYRSLKNYQLNTLLFFIVNLIGFNFWIIYIRLAKHGTRLSNQIYIKLSPSNINIDFYKS